MEIDLNDGSEAHEVMMWLNDNKLQKGVMEELANLIHTLRGVDRDLLNMLADYAGCNDTSWEVANDGVALKEWAKPLMIVENACAKVRKRMIAHQEYNLKTDAWCKAHR